MDTSLKSQHRPSERPLFGEDFILCPQLELARTRGGPWQHEPTIEVGSRRRISVRRFQRRREGPNILIQGKNHR